MGQYWYVTNVDKFEGYNIGKLGETFFDCAHSPARQLLTVPAVPIETGGFQKVGTKLAGSWAGDRIVCLGDYATDWPESLRGVPNLDFANPEDEDAFMQGQYTERCFNISERDVAFGYNAGEAYPKNRVCVLRNLSKKEYVRSDRIPIQVGDSDLEYRQNAKVTDFPGLAFILISRICWSSDPSISMSYDKGDELVRGIWAGDRIDFSIFELVKSEMLTGGWKDVSRREAEHMHDLVSQDTGTKWSLPDEPEGVEV